ncbi:hypothetical protein JTE90_002140 [Oedothorax gibbosus]|uniref:Uncharacterized protein n=1 Tax=Oedothorax gibbosus TaxID=931172 RepID=A0AAV6V6W2_9ARAC|nr:hypothetical protein JTE90_002140 [Oedothorax gibbosus]
MSNNLKNNAYGRIQNRHYSSGYEGDESCDELLIDTEDPTEGAKAVGPTKSASETMMEVNFPEDKFSERHLRNSEGLLPRSSHVSRGIADYSDLDFVNEISAKFSRLNTSPKMFGGHDLNPSTCHSDNFESLEQKSQHFTGKKSNIKRKQHEQFRKSPRFETRGLFPETPDDFCTKFKTLQGSNEKLITLDNVRDIKLKSKDLSGLNNHGFASEKKQQKQVSKNKDISFKNVAKPDTRISRNCETAGETSKKYKSPNSASNSSYGFTKNKMAENDKVKVRTEKYNRRIKEKTVSNISEDTNAKASNEVMRVNNSRIEITPKRPNLKNRRISLPAMQGSLSDIDTIPFDRRNSLSFGLPNPKKLPISKVTQSSKFSKKRLASSPIKNLTPIVGPQQTTSTKRRTDSQPDEPSSKFRKRCLSSTDAEEGDITDIRHRVRSSSDGETHESVSNESSTRKRVVDDIATTASGETQYTSKKLRQNHNINPMQ